MDQRLSLSCVPLCLRPTLNHQTHCTTATHYLLFPGGTRIFGRCIPLLMDLRLSLSCVPLSPRSTPNHQTHCTTTIPESNRTFISVPTTRPIVIIALSKPLSHTLRFFDETTPNRRAKPAGVMGAEVWVKIGDAPPTNTDELRFFGLNTRTPYISKFDSEDAGKTVYYRLRWVNPKGKPGPWSDIVSGPIMP